MLHVHNGESTASTARRSTIPGEHLSFRDALIAGPTPSDLKDAAWRKLRARHLSAAYGADAQECEQIPNLVMHAARRALVDHIGVTVAGSADDATRRAREAIAACESGGGATVVGAQMRVSPPFAAFLNAFASHVLDLDDVYNPPGTTVHGSCSVWPAILAVADNRLAGVEALARWPHRTLGVIEPSTFVPIAERFGLIDELTDWVLRRGLRQWVSWSEQGLRTDIAFNVSALSLRDVYFPDYLHRLCQNEGVPAACLTIEVT